jgi:hypothetical protein
MPQNGSYLNIQSDKWIYALNTNFPERGFLTGLEFYTNSEGRITIHVIHILV